MPRWRPIGMSRDQIIADDGAECKLRLVGRCVLPADTVSTIGSNEPHALSLDHILEQANHGPNPHPSNLITVHRMCNTVRGSRPFLKFVGKNNARILAQMTPRVAPTIRRCFSGTC
jgi:5-methylcytosine-specific restriction endonuclease McrA